MARARETTIAGVKTWPLAVEDLLLILCMNGAKDQWRSLKCVCDVAELLRAHPDLDIGTALARARSTHTLRILSVGLELARGLFGASLDGWRGEDLEQDSGAAALVDGVSARLLAVDQAPAGGVSVLLFRIQIR